MNSQSYVQSLREHELAQVAELLPRAGKVLEIGAGAGWQARALAERGYEVSAVDIADPQYTWTPVFPVTTYDGVHLPYPDAQFDVVFSSNVLEHVRQLPDLLGETARVLRPDGVAVHVLPTGTWRLWSNFTHYISFIQHLWKASTRRDLTFIAYVRNLLSVLWCECLPPRHGEVGNFLTEIWWFSRFRWRAEFRRAGWTLASLTPNRLAYTGNIIFGPKISLERRQQMSRWLGSTCLIYVLKKTKQA